MLQLWKALEVPGQERPPFAGAGSSQTRLLLCVPLLHVRVQVPQEAQAPHAPSTVDLLKINKLINEVQVHIPWNIVYINIYIVLACILIYIRKYYLFYSLSWYANCYINVDTK